MIIVSLIYLIPPWPFLVLKQAVLLTAYVDLLQLNFACKSKVKINIQYYAVVVSETVNYTCWAPTTKLLPFLGSCSNLQLQVGVPI